MTRWSSRIVKHMLHFDPAFSNRLCCENDSYFDLSRSVRMELGLVPTANRISQVLSDSICEV